MMTPSGADAFIIDQGWEHYTADDHAVWKTLFERQMRILPGRACPAFMQGVEALHIRSDAVPDFESLSRKLRQATGWEVVAVDGWVPHAAFYEMLSKRQFPAGNFIRKKEQLDYLQEPDVFHDVFGHVPMLAHPVFADYMQAFGEGGLHAERLGMVERLARVYWFTVEFGLIRYGDDLRIYGAGILSSKTESVFCLEDDSPHRLGFDLERILRTDYFINDLQPNYFVIDNFEQLLELADVSFDPFYERISQLPSYEPGVLCASDKVVTKGTGAYLARTQRAP